VARVAIGRHAAAWRPLNSNP